MKAGGDGVGWVLGWGVRQGGDVGRMGVGAGGNRVRRSLISGFVRRVCVCSGGAMRMSACGAFRCMMEPAAYKYGCGIMRP